MWHIGSLVSHLLNKITEACSIVLVAYETCIGCKLLIYVNCYACDVTKIYMYAYRCIIISLLASDGSYKTLMYFIYFQQFVVAIALPWHAIQPYVSKKINVKIHISYKALIYKQMKTFS